MVIRNSTVLHVDRLEESTDIRLMGGRIREIGRKLEAVSGEQVVEAEGLLAVPGLIDLHTHGLKNVTVQEGSLLEYSKLQLEVGVTACVPTVYGSPEANRRRFTEAMAETNDLRDTPNILGFRPEIMYVAKKGAGSTSSLSGIDPTTSEALYAAAKSHMPIWDVSPELEGAIPFIRWAREKNIVVSLAHTGATIEQTRAGVDAGIGLVTHLYDTFDLAQPVDPGVYPAGVTDYIQIEDRLNVEIVPDGVHVHPILVEKTLRCKGIERVVFVTDSLRGSGNPPGIYDGLAAGEQVEVTVDRGMRRVTDDALSGSCLTQLQSFRNAVRVFGMSIREASILCSRNQARLLGLRKGILASGMDGDLILLDRDFQLIATIQAGELVYEFPAHTVR
jgi:N-acetylglucosamine-6-phosphate deacetylase